MSKAKLFCYMCGEEATSVEHVPAKCFFPKGVRNNLITVPSCTKHNNDTSKDDEYVRGIVVSSFGNNHVASMHWKGAVRKSYLHSPLMFLKTYQNQKNDTFFHDRHRVDAVMIKIAYGLYYHIYKKVWQSTPVPFYNRFFFDDGESDIHYRLPDYKNIDYHIYDGENPGVFKYQYFEGYINGKWNCQFKLVFYEGFEVIILPVDGKGGAHLKFDIKDFRMH